MTKNEAEQHMTGEKKYISQYVWLCGVWRSHRESAQAGSAIRQETDAMLALVYATLAYRARNPQYSDERIRRNHNGTYVISSVLRFAATNVRGRVLEYDELMDLAAEGEALYEREYTAIFAEYMVNSAGYDLLPHT